MTEEAPGKIAPCVLCASVGLNPVGVKLLESFLDDVEGKLITLPDAVFVAREDVPEALPSECEDEELWRLKTDLVVDLTQPLKPDFLFSSAI